MLAALEGMIAESRRIGVPISPTEKIDAARSLRHLPLAKTRRREIRTISRHWSRAMITSALPS